MVLVTGTTGYVGGRLVPQLLDAGYRVRVLARDPERLQGRPWFTRVEVAQGDVLKPETLVRALNGVSAVYYLVHSMSELADFRNRDLPPRAISVAPRKRRTFSTSFIWVDWATPMRNCQSICVRGKRQVTRCASQVCRSLNSARRLSSGRAVCRLKSFAR